MDDCIPIHKLKKEPYFRSMNISCAEHCPMDILLEELSGLSDVNTLVIGVGECVYYSRKIPFSEDCKNWSYGLSNEEIVFGDLRGIASALKILTQSPYRTVCIFTCVPSLMNLDSDALKYQFPDVVFISAPDYKGISPYDILEELYFLLFRDCPAGQEEGISVWEKMGENENSLERIGSKLRAKIHVVNHPDYLKLLEYLANKFPLTVIDNSRFHPVCFYEKYAEILHLQEADIRQVALYTKQLERYGRIHVKGPCACDFAAYLHKAGVKISCITFDGRCYHARAARILRELPGDTPVCFVPSKAPVQNGSEILDFLPYREEILNRTGMDRLRFMLSKMEDLCR